MHQPVLDGISCCRVLHQTMPFIYRELTHHAFQIIRDEQFRHAAEKGQKADLARFRTDDRHRRTTEVDKELLAGTMLLAHRQALGGFPCPVAAAELGVAQRVVPEQRFVLQP